MTRIAIAAEDPNDADARALIAELAAELTRVTGHFTATSYSPADASTPRAVFVVARSSDDAGKAVGCGAIRPLDTSHPDIAELKRMYARAGTHGVGHAILTHLERQARDFGYTQIWLETGVENERAIRFYQRHGYSAIPNFGPYEGRDEATCLGKRLDPIGGGVPTCWPAAQIGESLPSQRIHASHDERPARVPGRRNRHRRRPAGVAAAVQSRPRRRARDTDPAW